MPDTPLPDAPTELEHPRVATALQRARTALVVRPPANALDVAQGVLLPILSSLGIDVFDLEQLRLEGEANAKRVEYRLLGESELLFVVVPVDAPLPERGSDEQVTAIFCNGRDWRFGDQDATEIELFDESFPRSLNRSLNGADKPDSRTVEGSLADEGHDTGEKAPTQRPQRKEFVPAGPFERITLEEVRGYAEAVRNMRGKLQVWFDGEPVDVTSRSAFYYVLAELALRHGREDAISGEDLIVPPEEPPDERRARQLARPGWQLLVDHEKDEVEERTMALLEALGLVNQFSATQRGKPYPAKPE